MADVFLSYAREEQARAEVVRGALEALGLKVFFDVERLDAGDVWSDVVDRELKTAGAVVALWSPHALSRPWVKKECAIAQSRGVLLPALIEPVTDLDMPAQFFDLQRVDLTDYSGQPDHAGWRKLVRALAKTLKRNDLLAAQIAALKEEKQTARVKADLEAAQKELTTLRKSKGGVKPAWVAAGLAVVLVLAGTGGWWLVHNTRESIVPADVRSALVAIPAQGDPSSDQKRFVERAFQEIKLTRVIEASTIDPFAALLAGHAFSYGVGGVSQDEEEASSYYRRSCDLGNLVGCENLGFNLAQGDGVEKDYAAALSLFEKACAGGIASACSDVGIMYESGWGVAKDEAKAATQHSLACDAGSMRGCFNLANSYREGLGVPEDKAKAVALLDKACDGGEMEACFGLGLQYAHGTGAPKDESRAVSLHTKACDGGFIRACNELAWHYDVGAGVPEDPAKAVSLLDLACGEGMPEACFALGKLILDGRGAAVDVARSDRAFGKALLVFESSCAKDVAVACQNAGTMYLNGRSVPEDPVKAEEFFAKSCRLGNSAACREPTPAAPAPQ